MIRSPDPCLHPSSSSSSSETGVTDSKFQILAPSRVEFVSNRETVEEIFVSNLDKEEQRFDSRERKFKLGAISRGERERGERGRGR